MPVFKLKAVISGESFECFINDKFSRWNVFKEHFREGNYVNDLVDDIAESVKLSDWLWLHIKPKFTIYAFWLSTRLEQNTVEFTSEEVINRS